MADESFKEALKEIQKRIADVTVKRDALNAEIEQLRCTARALENVIKHHGEKP
jgi:prefoldin subunit 5